MRSNVLMAGRQAQYMQTGRSGVQCLTLLSSHPAGGSFTGSIAALIEAAVALDAQAQLRPLTWPSGAIRWLLSPPLAVPGPDRLCLIWLLTNGGTRLEAMSMLCPCWASRSSHLAQQSGRVNRPGACPPQRLVVNCIRQSLTTYVSSSGKVECGSTRGTCGSPRLLAVGKSC